MKPSKEEVKKYLEKEGLNEKELPDETVNEWNDRKFNLCKEIMKKNPMKIDVTTNIEMMDRIHKQTIKGQIRKFGFFCPCCNKNLQDYV